MTQNPLPLFADRILNLVLTGPMVRLELGVVAPPEPNDAEPQIAPSQTLVMPLDGFITSFNLLEQVMQQLAARGLVQKRPPEASADGDKSHPN